MAPSTQYFYFKKSDGTGTPALSLVPEIPPDVQKRLNDVIPKLGKDDVAANAEFAEIVTLLSRADIPAQILASPTLTIDELREEIKWQGDEFNQIDSKVGIVLGFILIFTGQLLTLFTTKHSDIEPFLTKFNQIRCLYPGLYILLGFIAASLIFGVLARWPQNFRGSVLDPDPRDSTTKTFFRRKGKKTALTTKTFSESEICKDLFTAIDVNRKILAWKSWSSKACNACAAVTLLGVVIMIFGAILYQQRYLTGNANGSAPPPVQNSAPETNQTGTPDKGPDAAPPPSTTPY